MTPTRISKLLFSAACVTALALQAEAQVRVTEVAPWSSGNSSLGADWFELTNVGSTTLDLSGWRVDDSSNSFGSSLLLNGISSIAAGESVIFIEGAAGNAATFESLWFGSAVPAGLQIGYYSGSGIGLSTSGDAVNIFNSGGTLQAGVSFGTSDGSSPYSTFDNYSGANGVTLSTLSAVGVNNAFLAANGPEIGSPGVAIPEPTTIALLLGAGSMAFAARRRKVRAA